MSKSADLFTPADELSQILGPDLAAEFVKHRKALKKPMTTFAAQLMAKKLRTFPDAVAAVEQAILKGWSDVYPTEAPSRGIQGTRERLRQEIIDEQSRASSQEDANPGTAGRLPVLGWPQTGRPH